MNSASNRSKIWGRAFFGKFRKALVEGHLTLVLHHSNGAIASSVRIAVSPAPTFHSYRGHSKPRTASSPLPTRKFDNALYCPSP